MASTAGGIDGRSAEGGGGRSWIWRIAIPTGESASKGRRPVSISKATTPAE
jgi:hypothetical protein